ncbi:MAG: hypothetical protein HY271_08000 [Deltaproteobacteria bacterium]|nr:hypothetical protein [Deltaproteobacteria bacterium]
MSTILDALKKVERDRESPRDESVEEVGLPATHPRRGIPMRVIIACAGIGFAAGIGLALWRDTAPLQQAAAPAPPAAPVIDVPPAPVAKAAPQPRAAPPPAPAAASPAGEAVIGGNPATNAVPAVIATAAPAAPPVVVGSAEHGGSALEPSPFTGDREVPAAAFPAAGGKHGVHGARRAQGAGSARGAAEDATPPRPVIALAPVVPTAPVLAPPPPAPEPLPAPEPPPAAGAEPAQPPPVAIDTGRSPPGSPRVALTFLQWSSDPERRFAFVSIDGAPAQRVREGDTASGMTVAQITPTGVQFKREGQLFMIRPRH